MLFIVLFIFIVAVVGYISHWVGGIPQREVGARRREWLDRPLPKVELNKKEIALWSERSEWIAFGYLTPQGVVSVQRIRSEFLLKDQSVEEFLLWMDRACDPSINDPDAFGYGRERFTEEGREIARERAERKREEEWEQWDEGARKKRIKFEREMEMKRGRYE